MPTSRRVHQGIQGRLQFRIEFAQRLSPATHIANPQAHPHSGMRPTVLQFSSANHNCVPCQTGRYSHGTDTAPAQLASFTRRPLATHSLIHQVGKRPIFEPDSFDRGSILRGLILLPPSFMWQELFAQVIISRFLSWAGDIHLSNHYDIDKSKDRTRACPRRGSDHAIGSSASGTLATAQPTRCVAPAKAGAGPLARRGATLD